MKQSKVMGDFLKKGGAVIAQVSEGLMKNPAFVGAVATAYRGKERLDNAVGDALKAMNVPSRSEFKRAVARIEALERELADSKGARKRAARRARRPAPTRRKSPPAGS